MNLDRRPQEFLHLLVEVDALGAEHSAVGGRWGLETGIETRKGPEGGSVFKVSLGLSPTPKKDKSLEIGNLHSNL